MYSYDTYGNCAVLAHRTMTSLRPPAVGGSDQRTNERTTKSKVRFATDERIKVSPIVEGRNSERAPMVRRKPTGVYGGGALPSNEFGEQHHRLA